MVLVVVALLMHHSATVRQCDRGHPINKFLTNKNSKLPKLRKPLSRTVRMRISRSNTTIRGNDHTKPMVQLTRHTRREDQDRREIGFFLMAPMLIEA